MGGFPFFRRGFDGCGGCGFNGFGGCGFDGFGGCGFDGFRNRCFRRRRFCDFDCDCDC